MYSMVVTVSERADAYKVYADLFEIRQRGDTPERIAVREAFVNKDELDTEDQFHRLVEALSLFAISELRHDTPEGIQEWLFK